MNVEEDSTPSHAVPDYDAAAADDDDGFESIKLLHFSLFLFILYIE